MLTSIHGRKHIMQPTGQSSASLSPAPASSAATRKSIAEAAARLFAEHGYDNTSVRAIATAAGADPALVIRYFGSKEDLFLATIHMHRAFDEALQAPLPELAARMVTVAAEMRGTRALRIYGVLMRASGHPKVGLNLNAAITQGLVEPLAAKLTGSHRRVRSHLIVAQMLGLLDALALREDEALLAADAALLVHLYAPAVDALIFPAP